MPTGIGYLKAAGCVITPNPVVDFAELNLPQEYESVEVTIFDPAGRCVLRLSEISRQIDLRRLHSGLYSFRAAYKGYIRATKFIQLNGEFVQFRLSFKISADDD